jgi:outer membrane protein assembly factor BamA
VTIGQFEVRVPSPIWSSRVRLAAFVDAGSLWERGKGNLAPFTLRITPGFGIRIATPLGPRPSRCGVQPLRPADRPAVSRAD